MNSLVGVSTKNERPRHGGDIQWFCQKYGFTEDQILDLSTGISPWSWPVPEIPQKVWQSLPYGDFGSNGNQPDLIEAASAYYQCEPKNLLPVAGSQMAIEALPRIAQADSEVLIPMIGYAEHAFQWQCKSHRVREYSHLGDLLSQLKNSDAKYAVVINPNNPGTDQYSPDELLPIAGVLGKRGGFLIVDEAFVDTSPELSLAPHASEEPLVVLRSIGKFFGLAGLRLGFIVASESLISRLIPETGLWSVSGSAHWLGARMLKDSAWVTEQKIRVQHESSKLREWLQQRVPALQWKSYATFVSGFGEDKQVRRLESGLAQSGILVRRFNGAPSIPSIIRLSLVDEPKLQRLKVALEEMEKNNEI